MSLETAIGLEDMYFEFEGDKLSVARFKFNSTLVELKASGFEHVHGPFYSMPTTVLLRGQEKPTETYLRYDAGRGSFIDTLLPWPTPYKDLDHGAFDIEMAECDAVWYMSMVVRAFIGAGKIALGPDKEYGNICQ